jgi:release factor glutamine methyltransferase
MMASSATRDGTCTSVGRMLQRAVSLLSVAGVPSPRLDAEVLLAHTLGWERARLYARPEWEPTEEQQRAYWSVLNRRERCEPIPYITGHREFYGLDFFVDSRVLIPRPETELLVELALETAVRLEMGKGRPLIADVGTGSGIIAISLAVTLPGATVYATDVSAGALHVAARNVEQHNVVERVQLLLGDLLDPLPQPVHLIAANLPYVSTEQLAEADPDVVDYEPLLALEGGGDGLAHIRRMLSQTGEWLLPQGAVLLEIGAEQGEAVMGLAAQHCPGARVELFHDYAGHDRVVRIQF